MGTDRNIQYQGVCNCGHGTLHIDECTPDHGWPTSTPLWYESRIDCTNCQLLYEIERRGKKFVLVEKRRLQEREAIRHEAETRGLSLMANTEVKAALQSLDLMLANERSVAAICRVLKAAGLTDRSESSFRNHWREPQSWIRANIRPRNLDKALNLVKISPPEVMQELLEISELSEVGFKPVDPVGAPFYELP